MRPLSFPATYYLAYRDLPAIISQYVAQHVSGREALDFGCGAGRSTRFLKKLGFNAVGIDISSSMIQVAKTPTRVESIDWSPMATLALSSLVALILYCPRSLLTHTRRSQTV